MIDNYLNNGINGYFFFVVHYNIFEGSSCQIHVNFSASERGMSHQRHNHPFQLPHVGINAMCQVLNYLVVYMNAIGLQFLLDNGNTSFIIGGL